MAAPEKRTVPYFPFYVKNGRTLTILESRFKCMGSGFFTNVLRILSDTPDHYICLNDQADREYFFAQVKCDPETGLEMLSLMAMTGKLDPDLYNQAAVIASDDFLQSIKDAYSKRTKPIITIKEIRARFGITEDENGITIINMKPETPISGVGNEQTKEKKNKGKQTPETPVSDPGYKPTSKGHFSRSVGEYLEEIERYGREIQADGFKEIWQTVQQWANQGIHAGAIAEVLKEAAPYLKTAKNKQGYIRAIMKTKAQNWREKGFIAEHEKTKADFAALVEGLKTLNNKIHSTKKSE